VTKQVADGFRTTLETDQKVPGLRNASVGIAIDIVYIYTMSMGIATVTQECFESQYYITRALFGTRSLFAMTAPLVNMSKTGYEKMSLLFILLVFHSKYSQKSYLFIEVKLLKENKYYSPKHV